MAECKEFLVLISASVDGELDSSESETLAEHLAGCEDCRACLEAYRVIRECAPELEVHPPGTLAKGIMYKIGLEKRHESVRGIFGPRRFSLIGLAAALVIMVWVIRGGEPWSNRDAGEAEIMPMENAVDSVTAGDQAPERAEVYGAEYRAAEDAAAQPFSVSGFDDGAAVMAKAAPQTAGDGAAGEGIMRFSAAPLNATPIEAEDVPQLSLGREYGTVAIVSEEYISPELRAAGEKESCGYSYFVVSREVYDAMSPEWASYSLYESAADVPESAPEASLDVTVDNAAGGSEVPAAVAANSGEVLIIVEKK